VTEYTGAVIEAQPDWLTVSVHSQKGVERMGALARILQDAERAEGNKLRKYQMMGYQGTIAGRVAYGTRDASAAELRLSGDMAALAFDDAVACGDRITRLDVAVTWQSPVPVPHLGMHDYLRAKAWWQDHPASALPSRNGDAAGGFTFYLGKRASEYYFREYNKEAQERAQMKDRYDGRYDRCWRFELETKASVPWALMKKLRAAEDRAEFVQGYVHTYMVGHGLTPPFLSLGGQQLVPGFRRASDADSKIAHLGKNVKPTLDWLREQGELERALDALGLKGSNQTHTDA